MAKQPDIIALRLVAPGLVQGNTSKTFVPDKDQELRWHPQGVEVVRKAQTMLIPWNSIASVTYETPKRQKSERPTPRKPRARTSARAEGATTPPGPSPSR